MLKIRRHIAVRRIRVRCETFSRYKTVKRSLPENAENEEAYGQ
jgi:hypothetical protein